MSEVKSNYLKRAPGQVCQRCGVLNEYRTRGTKWCRECSQELGRRATRATNTYHKMLTSRDERKEKDLDNCCKYYSRSGATFCGTCGQRLQGRGGYDYDTSVSEEELNEINRRLRKERDF